MRNLLRPAIVLACIAVVAAALAANLIVHKYGVSVTPYVAFGLIGLDVVARDRLHLDWNGRGLWLIMGALIAVGSLATYLVNADAGVIAKASVVAFAGALTVDTVVFSALGRLDPQRRVNLSNTAAAATDTLLFFAIGFGLSTVPFLILASQFFAKVAGGAIYGALFVRGRTADLYAE